MKLTTHLHLVPSFRLSGAVPLHPHTLSWLGRGHVCSFTADVVGCVWDVASTVTFKPPAANSCVCAGGRARACPVPRKHVACTQTPRVFAGLLTYDPPSHGCVWPYNTLSIFHSDNRTVCGKSVQGDVSGSTPPHKVITLVGKGKGDPLQAWTGPEGSRRLRLPDFKTIGT